MKGREKRKVTRAEALNYAIVRVFALEHGRELVGDECKSKFQDELDFYHAVIRNLRPITREQVEKAWRGEWQMVSNGSGICSECHRQDKIDPLAKFCRYCGAPLTDEAVDMMMERLEALYNE